PVAEHLVAPAIFRWVDADCNERQGTTASGRQAAAGPAELSIPGQGDHFMPSGAGDRDTTGPVVAPVLEGEVELRAGACERRAEPGLAVDPPHVFVHLQLEVAVAEGALRFADPDFATATVIRVTQATRLELAVPV